ncbi:uncharacterized protein EDB91DRAFT_1333379 [Suillus paluster]|uniref:uncharacterized protein n=1 Tax=Suillus paluster TaxID=48578 RepID=UPI001B8650BA|nr:uncharacterized protein EDB91DRAFT_1333379 [Suillus paluster]KAG1752359.1 hypothetical protein EDB91DRAFT_1333379 [Suillus paluster]
MRLGGQNEHCMDGCREFVAAGIGTGNPSGVGTVNFSTRSCSRQNFAENRTLCARGPVGSARLDWKIDGPQFDRSTSANLRTESVNRKNSARRWTGNNTNDPDDNSGSEPSKQKIYRGVATPPQIGRFTDECESNRLTGVDSYLPNPARLFG